MGTKTIGVCPQEGEYWRKATGKIILISIYISSLNPHLNSPGECKHYEGI